MSSQVCAQADSPQLPWHLCGGAGLGGGMGCCKLNIYSDCWPDLQANYRPTFLPHPWKFKFEDLSGGKSSCFRSFSNAHPVTFCIIHFDFCLQVLILPEAKKCSVVIPK